MARSKVTKFALRNVTNAGRRGRPPMPEQHENLVLSVLNSKGVEVGTVQLSPDGEGVSLAYTVGTSKAKTIAFPAVAAPAKARGRRAAAKPSTASA